jgi:hypothetical protein
MVRVRFQVLTAASMKMTAFWDTALCILVDVSEAFTASIIRVLNLIITLMTEAVSTSETSVNF